MLITVLSTPMRGTETITTAAEVETDAKIQSINTEIICNISANNARGNKATSALLQQQASTNLDIPFRLCSLLVHVDLLLELRLGNQVPYKTHTGK